MSNSRPSVRETVRAAVLATVLATLLVASACGAPEGLMSAPGGEEPRPKAYAGEGVLLSAGLNDHGQLGRGSGESADALAPVRGTGGDTGDSGVLRDVTEVAGGGRHSLAVRSDGSVLAWGANDFGQLGDGTRRQRATPVRVRAPAGESGHLDDVTHVWADTDFSMARRSDGTLVTWGKGDAGQRGTGRAPETSLVPTTVLAPDGRGPLTGVRDAAADGRTEVAVLDDGSVLAWGANDFGQVGDGTTVDRDLPVPVTGLRGGDRLAGVAQVSAGGQHMMAVLEDGRVVTWGRNELGQLGDGARAGRPRPGLVTGRDGGGVLRGVRQVSAAEKHGYALTSDGRVLAWGNNTAGQLGDGTTTLRATPVPVTSEGGEPLSGVSQVFAGEAYGAALRDDGSLWTWGANGYGQLASGDGDTRSVPGSTVSEAGWTPDNVVTVAPGERHLLVVVGR